MCDVRQLSELVVCVFGIKEIDCDMSVAWSVRRLSSRQTHHLPIGLLGELLGDVAPNDTERTDNDRLILHSLPYW